MSSTHDLKLSFCNWIKLTTSDYPTTYITYWIDLIQIKYFLSIILTSGKEKNGYAHKEWDVGRTWLVRSTNTKKIAKEERRHPWYYQFVVNIVHQKHFPTCSILLIFVKSNDIWTTSDNFQNNFYFLYFYWSKIIERGKGRERERE